MIRFDSDYLEGAHPEIIKRLADTNFEQTPGYGQDPHCENARRLIKEACAAPNAHVHFLVGGTQANVTVIASALKPYQGVICATTGHINVHETGAVEHSGHKALAIHGKDGKITAQQIDSLIENHYADASFEHTVQPGMVYISFPTELGTLYTLQELTDISTVCRKHDIPLFIDGARLGYGLMSQQSNVTLKDIARLSDIFYIGGTKVGCLFGEAVVINKESLKKDFRYNIKQEGGMLAKGRLLGIQFETLFTDNLYFKIAANAIEMAQLVRNIFASRGYRFLADSPTNQQFPILPNDMVARLHAQFGFEDWQKVDDNHTAVRFCTSWWTPIENIKALEAAL